MGGDVWFVLIDITVQSYSLLFIVWLSFLSMKFASLEVAKNCLCISDCFYFVFLAVSWHWSGIALLKSLLSLGLNLSLIFKERLPIELRYFEKLLQLWYKLKAAGDEICQTHYSSALFHLISHCWHTDRIWKKTDFSKIIINNSHVNITLVYIVCFW